jgi:hypothetical protein
MFRIIVDQRHFYNSSPLSDPALTKHAVANLVCVALAPAGKFNDEGRDYLAFATFAVKAKRNAHVIERH